jgi:deoxyribonuclease-4
MPPRCPRPLPVIGAHVSAAGGLDNVLLRARAIGAEAVQLFPSSPRQWRPCRHPAAAARGFRAELAAAGIPLFLHTIYLINLAAPDPEQRQRSVAAVSDALVFGARAGAAGVVTHLGSHRGEGFDAACPRVAEALDRAVEGARAAAGGALPPLLLETAAGGRGSVGDSPGELGRLLSEADRGGQLGVCLDSAHLFAAGYPVHTTAGLDETLRRFDAQVGLERVGLVHLNDSATPLGSRRDRHANLWTGELGREGVAGWVRSPRLRGVPFVLETPGFDGNGPDHRNLWRAKRLRGAAQRAADPQPSQGVGER